MKRIFPKEEYQLYRRAYNLHASIKQRCMKKGLPQDLDVEWIVSKLKGKCEVTDLSFRLDTLGKNIKFRHQLAPSIDRIIPELGYTKANCRMVIWWYNCAKQTFTDRDLWHLCNLVVNSLGMNSVLSAKNMDEIKQATT